METVSAYTPINVLASTYKTNSVNISCPLLGYARSGLGCRCGVPPYIAVIAAHELADWFTAEYPQRLYDTPTSLSVTQNWKHGRQVISITY